MSEHDLTGSLPEEDELFLPPEEDFNTHGFELTKLQQFSDAEIEAFDRDSREISIEAESLALTHSSGEVLDEEIAKMLGEEAVGPVLLEAIESLDDEWGAPMAMLDERDDPPDIAVGVPVIA